MTIEEMTVEEWKQKNPPIRRKLITNADKIRAMTDEELAKYLYRMVHDCMMGVFPGWHFTPEKEEELIQSWLNWLQEECDDAKAERKE